MQEWVSATRGLSPRVATGVLGWSGPQVVDHFARQDQRREPHRSNGRGLSYPLSG